MRRARVSRSGSPLRSIARCPMSRLRVQDPFRETSRTRPLVRTIRLKLQPSLADIGARRATHLFQPAGVQDYRRGTHTNAAIGQRLSSPSTRSRSTRPASTPRWTSKDAQTSHRSRPVRTASSASTGFLERSRPAQGSASARAEISGDAHPGEKAVGHPGGSSISHR
jgi:hypothetical protein